MENDIFNNYGKLKLHGISYTPFLESPVLRVMLFE